MKKFNIILLSLLALNLIFFSSCNDKLDEMPDQRAEVKTKKDIQKLLVSAYPERTFSLIAELYSDNTDDIGGVNNPYFERFTKEVFEWSDTDQTDNESSVAVWEACYSAISAANHALEAIEKQGFPEDLNAERAEALLARAYGHFVLVNVFCQHYTKEFGATDLGIPFTEKPEKTLNPKYERGTVADVYEKIDRDLQIALPLVSDEYYTVPKYHFNVNAANAFAARFYLYYQDFDKAIEYASKVLGSAPLNMMRDNAAIADIPRDPMEKVSTEYIHHRQKGNLLLMTNKSALGLIYGAFYTGSRFNHASETAKTESITFPGPWGTYDLYYLRPFIYEGANLNKILLPRFPYLFEYTDPVALKGYRRTVYAAFTAEETLLVRAEAYILKKEYKKAVDDMNIWIKSTHKSGYQIENPEEINSWVGVTGGYYTPKNPTPMKELNPEFLVEKGLQENMIHLLLFMRRYETLHTGLRWFDLKRYGIVVHRRLILSGKIAEVFPNPLEVRDPRRAIQIPSDILEAGIEPNPR
ncbi:RagB/SusD family nutrient uptake outer membrane protein [Dysgonomonas massiliensis]|uniref:RagB/SusD family nutrient uptake outer membrane protein n=1 Tax=Dysgonomonas massiliensis TaxID=2040292 RepID=UPI000C756BE7|nr:RagB/SusD family nutrient uptake outer membrane protein [Dysgonomonas massiliensis]